MELTLEQIPALAAKFKPLKFDPDAKRSVEVLGCAFVWTDEKPLFEDTPDGTISVTRFFQYLLWYRKSLIQQKPFGPFTEYWEAFRDACPTWPGFHPERCSPSLHGELTAEVETGMAKLDRFFDLCERKRRRGNENNVD